VTTLQFRAATPSTQTGLLPSITAQNVTVDASATIEASSVIASVSDPYGYAITSYDFRDDGGGGGHLSLDGVTEPTDTWITVAASDLAQLRYIGAASAGSETLDVAAWDGLNWSYYQTATVTTLASYLPVITAANQTVEANGSIAAASLIAGATDPNGYAITYYDFRDDGGGGGSLTLNGVTQDVGSWITLAASDLSELQYVGGSQAGSESIEVAAWDGYNWSYYQTATVTTDGLKLPAVTVQNQTVQANGLIQAASLIAATSDPNGYAITFFDFRDDGGGGGHFSLNGVTQATGTWITVAARDLSELQYIGGVAAGTETVDVAAWDGANWSYFQTATVTTDAVSSVLPVITAKNQAVAAGGSIAAASLIASVSDPGGHSITEYDFRDDGGGGGHLSLSGVTQATGSWITVAPSALPELQFIGAAAAGSETVDVAAYDGTNWSYYQTAIVTTQAVLPPVITVADASVNTDSSIDASALISTVIDPNNLSITAYDFRDDGGGGGYLSLNGVTEPTGTWITVSAADLSQLQFVGGATAGSETIDVAASNGEVWSTYETATVITKPAQNVNPPVVVVNNATVNEYQSIQASSLIASVSDPNNLAITYDGFRDQGGNGGYFILNGVQQATDSWITVSATDLSQLLYVGGSIVGSESVEVAVWDGQSWSDAAPATIDTQAPQDSRPVLTAQNGTVSANGSIQASSLIASVSDPGGLTIAAYDVRDDGGNGGHLTLNGATQATDTWITVAAGDLAKLQYVGAASAGSETIDLAASDGVTWSYYQTAVVTTAAAAGLPVIEVQNQTVATGASIQASSLIASVNDPNGHAITSYEFRDDGGGGGYLSLNGAAQATDSWITVTSANLPQLQFVGAAAAGTETLDVAAWDGVNWSNYATAIVATQGALPADPVLDQLTDAGVKADAAKYIVNNSLDYTGMLAILDDVAKGGVTASEFADLQTIAASFNKTNGIQVSPYLASISTSLIDGDAANAEWTGGAMTPVALGNLAAGSSQTQMNELIGKWFLGTDLPAPVFDNTSGAQIDYVADSNPLFGASGVPSINDINQGQLGDCYLLASLAEIAQDQPAEIESMFTDDGNGSYGVRFYIDGEPRYVTVNTELPEYAGTDALCGNNAPDIWGCLIEKAYVELNADPGYLEHTTGNVYNLIDGGFADPITQITGRTIVTYNTASYSSTTWATLKSDFVTAIQSGEEVDFASHGTTELDGQTAFVADHMFSGLGYDSATGDFIVRNPWGVEPGQSWLTEFEASIADLYSVNGAIFVASGVAADTPSITSTAPCFVTGTRIATATGHATVESLRPGDRVVTVCGTSAPVTWVGHRRVDCRRHPQPRDVWPVRVRQGAFGARLPERDLWLSPDHAVYVAGSLIPIRYLINDASIVQEPVESVTYWHVELDRHNVILAEQLPCESFLDTGNRGAFENGGAVVSMHPDFARHMWEAESCAPLVVAGPELDRVRVALGERLLVPPAVPGRQATINARTG